MQEPAKTAFRACPPWPLLARPDRYPRCASAIDEKLDFLGNRASGAAALSWQVGASSQGCGTTCENPPQGSPEAWSGALRMNLEPALRHHDGVAGPQLEREGSLA